MARVDFYILKNSGAAARQHFACRLAEKAYRQENSVHIQVVDQKSAHQLNELLWTFRDESFVPHEVTSSQADAPETPVTISMDGRPDGVPDLLINLTDEIPGGASTFARIAEIVTSDDDSKATSRTRYSAYRDAGHELESHKL